MKPPSDLTSEIFVDVNRYGFDHEAVSKRFGPSTYVGTFSFGGGYLPWAVYRAHKPDKSKGHKKYFMLQVVEGIGPRQMIITGLTAQAMQKYRYRSAIKCLKCDTIVFSSYRHDCHECDCKETAIDGGADYTRIVNPAQCVQVSIDLLRGKRVYR